MRYSICITHLNDAPTIEESLGSILSQIDDNFEVVVVDQGSTDGSYEYLKSLSDKGQIKLVKQKVRNRGLGRQKAFEESSGQYIVAGMDMDDVYEPRLKELLEAYHAHSEGLMLRLKPGGVTIAQSSLIKEIGGWTDLHTHEDTDLWQRAEEVGKLRWANFPLYKSFGHNRTRKEHLAGLATAYRDIFRVGSDRADFLLMRPKNRLRFLPFLVAGWVEAQFAGKHYRKHREDLWTPEQQIVLESKCLPRRASNSVV
jgi:glycosyltransferase involved in cell wall biosynthesis